MESPSATLDRALPFAPTAAGLSAVLDAIAASAGGSAVSEIVRRDALARFLALPAPGGRPPRGWRHDYAKLPFDGLAWSSERTALPGEPRRAGVGASTDGPALETANVAGLVHAGSTSLEPSSTAHFDERVVVLPLAEAVRAHRDLVAGTHLAAAAWRDDAFAALSVAFQNCGAFVYVPDGVVLDAPVALMWAERPHERDAVFPHIVVVLGAGARASVIERHLGDGENFVSSLVECRLGEGAQLDYSVVQQAGDGSRLFARRSARVAKDARVRWSVAELGGALSRDAVDAHLEGTGAAAELAGLFFNTEHQHVDLTTTVEHAVGDTTSTTVVRSAAVDRGQGRYLGNIVIRAGAHGSDASLRDDALLLSATAHIDSIPALEIAANDVKAFHGATVGSLDEDELFYAQSRGIPRPDAIRMVALGFFEPAVARFPTETLREEIRTALDAKIDAATETAA